MYIKNYLDVVSTCGAGYPLETYFASKKEVKAYSEDGETWIDNEFYDEVYAIDLLKEPNRIKGEQLLKDSDWTQLTDVVEMGRITTERKNAFKTWRQTVYNSMNEVSVDWSLIEGDRP